MIELILIILGLNAFLEALLDKWGIWDYLHENGHKTPSRLIYELSQCRFCLTFWTGVLLTGIVSLISGPELQHLVIPLVIAGLRKIFER